MTPSRFVIAAPSSFDNIYRRTVSDAEINMQVRKDGSVSFYFSDPADRAVLRALRGIAPSHTSKVEGMRPGAFFHYTPTTGTKVVCDLDPDVEALKDPQRPAYGIPGMGENLNPPRGVVGVVWPNGSLHVVITSVGVTRLTLGCNGERRNQIWRLLEQFTVPACDAPSDPSEDDPLRYLMLDAGGLIHLYLNAAHAPVVWRAIERNCFTESRSGRHGVDLLDVEGDLIRWERTFDVLTSEVRWTPATYTHRAQACEALTEGWMGEVFGTDAPSVPTYKNATPAWVFGDLMNAGFSLESHPDQRASSWLWKALERWAEAAAQPIIVPQDADLDRVLRGGVTLDGRQTTAYDLAGEIKISDDLDYKNLREMWRDLGHAVPIPQGHADAPSLT